MKEYNVLKTEEDAHEQHPSIFINTSIIYVLVLCYTHASGRQPLRARVLRSKIKNDFLGRSSDTNENRQHSFFYL